MASPARVIEVSVPGESDSKLRGLFRTIDFADAWQTTLSRPDITPDAAAIAIFGQSPGWVNALMKVRGVFAHVVGLKHSEMQSGEQQKGIFRVQQREVNEIILGENDKHLDFRISVLRGERDGRPTLTVSTVVETHNALGRAYIAVVKPFHRVIARSMVQRAVNAGRL